MKKIITKICTLLPIVATTLMLTACNGDGDNSGENWILAILVLLAWLKGGK